MPNKLQLDAQIREITGRKVKKLRKEEILPAVLYGHGFEPSSIQVPMKEFEEIYNQAGESTLVYLKLEGQTYPTIIQNVDFHPVDSNPIHADFHKVRLDKPIIAPVPLLFTGESPAVKNLEGVLVKNIQEVEVKALPAELPSHIEVDISVLAELEQHIQIKDLPVSDKVEIQANQEDIVALVQSPISDEELEKSLEGEKAAVEDVEVATSKEEEEKTEAESSQKDKDKSEQAEEK